MLAAIALYVQRSGSAIWSPYLYAEDGSVFLQQQLLQGVSAVVTPFAGYLHLVPRLTAMLAAPFGAVHAPEVYALCALLVMVWTAITIAMCRLSYAWLLPVLMFLVPHNGEVFGTITNAQWLMACALPLIALTPAPESRAARFNQLVFVFTASLTGPFCVFAAPLFLYRWWRVADVHGTRLAWIVLASAALQMAVAASSYAPFEGETQPWHLALTLLDKWFGILAHGWYSESPWKLLLTMLMVGLLVGLCLRRQALPLNLGLMLFGATILAAAWWKFLPGHSAHFDWPDMSDRYAFVPRVMAMWVLASGLFASNVRGWVIASSVALTLCVVKIDSHGLGWWEKHNWEPLPWREQAALIDAGQAIEIPINPPPYSVDLRR